MILSVVLVFLSSFSFAQTLPVSILELSKRKATSDLTESTRLLNAEIAKGQGFNACRANELLAKQEYSQWFVDHASDFDRLSNKVDLVVSAINEKLKLLKSETIRTNAVQGQESAEVEMSFEKLIEYFNLYNGRLKTCTLSSEKEVIAQMENPKLNYLHVAHTQVVAAMEKMTTNLNSALKEPDLSYELTFVKEACGYRFNLKGSFLLNDVKRSLEVTLVDPTKNNGETSLQITDAIKWNMILNMGILIDGFSLEGTDRFLAFYKKNQGTCSSLPALSKSAKPYVGLSEISPLIQAAETARIEKLKREQEKGWEKPAFHARLSQAEIIALSPAGLYAKINKYDKNNWYFIHYQNCALYGGVDLDRRGAKTYAAFYDKVQPMSSVQFVELKISVSEVLSVVSAFQAAVKSGACDW